MDNGLIIKYDSTEEMLRNIHYKVCRADYRIEPATKKRELVEYIEACDQVDAKPISDENMVKHVAYIWLSPAQVFQLWLSCLWWKYCARKTTRS